MRNKVVIVNLGILALIGLVGLSLQQAIAGSTPTLTLQPAAPLVGQIAQAIGPVSQGKLLIPSQDFTLTTKYFDNNTWVVVNINPVNQAFNASTAVMEQKDGIYQLELGPGSAFLPSQLTSIPADVAAYINSGGAANGTTE
jgi:hypothetical protein